MKKRISILAAVVRNITTRIIFNFQLTRTQIGYACMRASSFREVPLSNKGRSLLYANILMVVLLVVIPIACLPYMPATVPSHWNASGQVTNYSSSFSTVMILAVVMPLANIIIVLITAFRWKIINKYPYLINLPAITLVISTGNMDQYEKSRIINRIFEVTLLLGLVIGVYLLGLDAIILDSMITGHSNGTLVLLYSIIGAIVLIVPVILLYRKIYREEILPKIKLSY
ncbi:MAG: DUF1648 domain-containing protein [Desulfurococcales archaeon]|nr:DUF1648 domain-containing protein [Desulfurococcales archaeon]